MNENTPKKFYCEKKEEVLSQLNCTETGLSSEEANERLATYGKNKLAEAKKVPLWKRFLAQLADPMIIILIVAAFISAITSVYSSASGGESEGFADVIIIMAVVIINAVLGVFQESKAEKAIKALQEMAAATSKVLRDGEIIHVRSEELVPGDIVILEAGDAVPADGRLLEAASLKIEEAALTGESVPATKEEAVLCAADGKDVPLGDRTNMVYMGSTVVYGRGKAVIAATGMETEMGKIATALTMAEEGKTPLQIKLGQLSKILTYLVIGICVVIFGVQLLENGIAFSTVLDSFMIAVSLAVAAIPEGLATVVTIVLSLGVTTMSKKNAIIRKLTAVETLGCAQIICSDKTGTLTQNKMTVVKHSGSDEKLLASAMSLCSDAAPDATGEAVGEPTECALVNYGRVCGLPKNELTVDFPRIGEAPFDSMHKMMSTVHNDPKGGFIQYTKGAPDEVLKRCTSYLGENGEILPLDESVRTSILSANKGMADEALRVLCAAFRRWSTLPVSFDPEALENDLTYIGLCGMIDPIRPEVKAAIEECHSAGIRAIMITGDHIDTAVAIAKQLGIIESREQATTGASLDDLTDEQLDATVEKFGVYARVQPEHKVRIVNAWRRKGFVTAMTGDGVNDAPSIKSADIGVGMGITGTDVTKNVADMVLADDNFATIVSAVGEGRRIYANIRKAIQFLLASNLSEVLSIFIATLIGFTIFQPVHLLWINLITDCFPALSLGMEKAENNVMKQPPRNAKEGIFAGGMGISIAYQGILVTLITLISYFIGFKYLSPSPDVAAMHGTSMAFLTLSMAEICHSFNMRSLHGSVFTLKKQNIWLWGAALLSLGLTTVVVEIPALSNAFDLAELGLTEYAVALGLAVSMIPLVEICKAIERLVAKHRKA